MQIVYPIVQVLLYIALLFAPPDADRISITGPDQSFELTRNGGGWEFTQQGRTGKASIGNGSITIEADGKRESHSVARFVAATVGHDWKQQPKVTLHDSNTLEKTTDGYVLRIDDGKPGMKVYRITWHRAGLAAPGGAVNVLGAVKNPGIYPLGQATTLSDLLAAAGGPTAKADIGKSRILRGNAGERPQVLPVDLGNTRNGQAVPPPLLDHDTLFVSERIRADFRRGETGDSGAVIEVGKGESVVRSVQLPDADTAEGPKVLDLASGKLLDVPVEGAHEIIAYFNKLGQGDLAWDNALSTLRGAQVHEWKNGVWKLLEPDRESMGCSSYRFQPPRRLRVTTAEGVPYLVNVLKGNDGGVQIEFRREVARPAPEQEPALPSEVPANSPEADPVESAKAIPVTPPGAMPEDSPLTVEQVEGSHQGRDLGRVCRGLCR